MTARDDYPLDRVEFAGGGVAYCMDPAQWKGMCDEIDRLTAERDALRRQAAIGAAVQAQPMLKEFTEPLVDWETCEVDPLDRGRLFTFNEKVNAMLRRFLAAGAPVSGDREQPIVSANGEPGLDVHTWFSLSYASYLTINRSLLQSMPMEWQHRFTALMGEMQDEFRDIDEPYYHVSVRDKGGRFVADPIPPYDRGRTFVQGRSNSREAARGY